MENNITHKNTNDIIIIKNKCSLNILHHGNIYCSNCNCFFCENCCNSHDNTHILIKITELNQKINEYQKFIKDSELDINSIDNTTKELDKMVKKLENIQANISKIFNFRKSLIEKKK